MNTDRKISSRIRQSSAVAHEHGQALIEYVLILSVVVIAALGTLALTGQSASAMIDNLANAPAVRQTTQPGATTTTVTTTTTVHTKKPKKPKR